MYKYKISKYFQFIFCDLYFYFILNYSFLIVICISKEQIEYSRLYSLQYIV